MTYPTLEKLFYKDASSERFSRHAALHKLRLESESTFRTGVMLEHGELFCAVPHELSLASEQVLRRERRVSALWRSLPIAALGAYLTSLILDEVVYSNGIEGVHSTRRQIELALEEARRDTSSLKGAAERSHAPFVEFANLYLGLTDSPRQPETLEDIRAIYDSVVRDALDEKDRIERSLFRTGPVYLEDHHGKTLHTGVYPETAIEEALRGMLALSHREDMPELYQALLAHFLFEYVHPFYDGNGRTGRYLLALHLSQPLSQATVLSLSRTIAENKAAYYRAFDDAEKPLNRAEGTHFVLTMLDLIGQAQESIIADLSTKQEALKNLEGRIGALDPTFSEREKDLLFYLGQMLLFSPFGEARAADAATYLKTSRPTARKYLDALVARGLARKTSRRPATYRLTPQAAELLGTPN